MCGFTDVGYIFMGLVALQGVAWCGALCVGVCDESWQENSRLHQIGSQPALCTKFSHSLYLGLVCSCFDNATWKTSLFLLLYSTMQLYQFQL